MTESLVMMIEIYKRTPVEKVLLFKEELWNIFDLSRTKAEAVQRLWGRG